MDTDSDEESDLSDTTVDLQGSDRFKLTNRVSEV